MEKLDIITIGEALTEFSSGESLTYADSLDKYFGGDTLSTAVAAIRLGGTAGYITKVASDAFKDFLIDAWQSEKLDISQVKVTDGKNGVYFVTGINTGKKEAAFYRKKTAAVNISEADIDENYIKSAKCVYATGVTQSISSSAAEAVRKMFKIASQNDITVAYDPNFNQTFWEKEEAKDAFSEISEYINVLFMNVKTDSLELWGLESYDKLMQYFWDIGISIIVIKSGPDKGFYVGANGEITFTPYYSDIKTDSTGAGDAFNGAFLREMLIGKSPFEAVKTAAIVSGLQVRGVGAIKSIPYAKDVEAAIKE